MAAADAADDAGIELVLLLSAYARGGLPASARSRSPTTSVRWRRCAATACESASPPLRPRVSARLAGGDRPLRRGRGLPSARARRRAAARDRGVPRRARRPADRAARPNGLPRPAHDRRPRTHADGAELDLLAESDARVCACPTTEANLGDGFLPVERLLTRGIGLCIGSDSNVRIDPLEELRELEGIARRQAGRRNVISVESLLCYGADEGAAALGLGRGRTSRSTSSTRRSAASRRPTCSPPSSWAAARRSSSE